MRCVSCIVIVSLYIGLCMGFVFAQEDTVEGGTIRGRITDTTPAQTPIADVEVKIASSTDPGKEFTVKTDANGEYKCTRVPPGRYFLNIYKDGYVERVGRRVAVVKGGDHFVRLRMEKKDNVLRQRLPDALLQHITDSIGKRYNLDEPVVEALNQSVRATLTLQDTVLAFQEAEPADHPAAWLEFLMLEPNCQVAFAKYLTETQLQDYLDFIQGRRQKAQEAIAQFMTALLDQVLSLTPEQRQNVMRLLLDKIEEEPQQWDTMVIAEEFSEQWDSSIVTLNELFLYSVAFVVLYDKFNVSLTGILNPTQSETWQVFKGSLQQALREDREEALVQLRQQLADAVLAAHTEQLGPLNEQTAKRLALVTKGVVQQYVETLEETRTSVDLKSRLFEIETKFSEIEMKLRVGEITRDQALESFNVLRESLWRNKKGKALVSEVIHHPLYQQTIKEGLSEEAYTAYLTRQVEKEKFGQQALHALVVVFIDNLLLLNETQRKHFEEIAGQMSATPLSVEGSFLMLLEFGTVRIDHEKLSPWQRSVFR